MNPNPIKIPTIIFLLVTTLSINAQTSKDLAIQQLQLETQYQIHKLKLKADSMMNEIAVHGQDSLHRVQLQAESEAGALMIEAKQELLDLYNKVARNPINRYLRTAHFERKYEFLENEYQIQLDEIEHFYEIKIAAINAQLENKVSYLEHSTELEIQKITAEYERKLVEINGK